MVVLALTFGGRARDTHNAVKHVQLFSGKIIKPSCMSTHESSKVARSQQANTTNIKHHNPLRQQASPAGGFHAVVTWLPVLG